jgi:hypothetical protein
VHGKTNLRDVRVISACRLAYHGLYQKNFFCPNASRQGALHPFQT